MKTLQAAVRYLTMAQTGTGAVHASLLSMPAQGFSVFHSKFPLSLPLQVLDGNPTTWQRMIMLPPSHHITSAILEATRCCGAGQEAHVDGVTSDPGASLTFVMSTFLSCVWLYTGCSHLCQSLFRVFRATQATAVLRAAGLSCHPCCSAFRHPGASAVARRRWMILAAPEAPVWRPVGLVSHQHPRLAPFLWGVLFVLCC